MEIAYEKLPNGLTVIAKKTSEMGIVALSLFIRGGIVDEEVPGSTALATYLVIKGSKNYSKEEISETFEDYGGGIGTSTLDEFSVIEFATKVEGLEKGLDVLRDIVLNPTFPEEDLEREKRNVITALRSKRENPFRYAFSELKKITFAGTPYERDVAGDEGSVSSITREVLFKRWRSLLEGERIVISLVGDFENTSQVVESVAQRFGDIERGNFSFPRYRSPIDKTELKRLKREGSQSTIVCAFNAPEIFDREYAAGKVLNAVLGEGFTSLLFRELREKRGYAYATTSFYPTRINLPRFFTYIGTSPDKEKNALEDMLKVVVEEPFDPEDVEVAKRKIIGDWLMDHQTRARQAWYLGWFEALGLGFETDGRFVEEIKKVSFEEVKAVRERYIKGSHHCVVVSP
jgi:predicted Zn-dependent peptidase